MLPTLECQEPHTFLFNFALAKTDTKYIRPDVHANWVVTAYLDLYFRTFVFPRTNDVNEIVVKV